MMFLDPSRAFTAPAARFMELPDVQRQLALTIPVGKL
jgi:hypothetical protein